MNDRRMLLVSADGCKTRSDKMRLLRAKFLQFFGRLNLSDRLGSCLCFQPVHKFGACDPVFQMRFPDIGDLRLIFYGFHPDHRIFTFDLFSPVPVYFGTMHNSSAPDPKNGLSLPEFPHSLLNSRIRM